MAASLNAALLKSMTATAETSDNQSTLYQQHLKRAGGPKVGCEDKFVLKFWWDDQRKTTRYILCEPNHTRLAELTLLARGDEDPIIFAGKETVDGVFVEYGWNTGENVVVKVTKCSADGEEVTYCHVCQHRGG